MVGRVIQFRKDYNTINESNAIEGTIRHFFYSHSANLQSQVHNAANISERCAILNEIEQFNIPSIFSSFVYRLMLVSYTSSDETLLKKIGPVLFHALEDLGYTDNGKDLQLTRLFYQRGGPESCNAPYGSLAIRQTLSLYLSGLRGYSTMPKTLKTLKHGVDASEAHPPTTSTPPIFQG